MIQMNKIICISLVAASLLTGCARNITQEKPFTVDNKINNEKKVSDAIEKYSQGCDIYHEGDTFDKGGMTITVNSSKITKHRDEWDDFMGLEEDEDRNLKDERYYMVVNMTIHVNDKENYSLGICGFIGTVLDKTTAEVKDRGIIYSSTYYNDMPEEIKASSDLFIDYPKEGEYIENKDFIILLNDDKKICEDNAYCFEVEERSSALLVNQGIDYVALVELHPKIEL